MTSRGFNWLVAGAAAAIVALLAFLGVRNVKLSAQQIAQYAANAGFQNDDLIVAVAIALAESSGNPQAHGDLTLKGSGSYGLWQIYSHAHPEFGPDFTQLFDPQTNANAAYQVFKAAGNSFTPWSTFNNAAYAKYLDQAGEGVNA